MTDTEKLPELPEEWCWTTIGEISEVKGGKRLPKGHDYSETATVFPYIRVTDFENMSINLESLKFLNSSTQKHISNYTISKNDIYISIAGSIGKVGMIPKKLDGSNLTENAAKITDIEYIDTKFLCYVLTSIASQEQIKKFTVSSNQPKLALFRIKQITIPLPPLPEQHRIVQKIEELFTDLGVGVQALEMAKVQVKNYRQAVLKLAIQGKLVQQNPEDEPALISIETIRKDLKEIIKDKINGKKLVSINSEDNLFELPDSWKWIRLGEVLTFGPKNGYSPKPVKHVTNVRALTLTATTSGKFRNDCFKYIDEKIDANSYLWLEENDILIQRGNTIEYVGVAAVYNGPSHAFIYPDLMMKMRVHPKINVDFLHMVLNSKSSRKYFEKRATGTAGSMPKINQGTIVNLPIPLLPLSEQHRIVSEIERRFSVIDQIEKTIDQSLNQAERLRQSILKKAFEGKLVPQDPNDEPASVLLEKIKQEKGRIETSKNLGKGRNLKAETIMEVSGKTKQAELF